MGISEMCPYGSEQYEWMRTAEVRDSSLGSSTAAGPLLRPCRTPLQIKHGRVCMAASVGFLVQESGLHFSGSLSNTPAITFADLSTMGALEAWDAVPVAGKAQIVAVAGLLEAFSEAKKPVRAPHCAS